MGQTNKVLPDGTIWPALGVVADLLATDPAKAEGHANELLKFMPGQQQALQLVVSARRARGDTAGARSILETMAEKYPGLAAAHYELGLLLADLGENAAAIKALSRVVELEPEHPAAWRALGEELAQSGNSGDAAKAFARQCRSSIIDVKMQESATALGLDQIETTVNLLREFVNIYPTDVNAIRLLGETYLRAKQFETAENLFARALELAPDFTLARVDYAGALQAQMKWEEQDRQLDVLLEEQPDNPVYRYLKATVLFRIGRSEESLQYCTHILRDSPDNPRFWLAYAYALRSVSRRDECIAAFRRSIELEPGLGESWWGLANLKTFRFTQPEIETMRAQLARADLAEEDRAHMHFALGRALEDRKAFDESFDHYSKGNASRRVLNPHSPEEITGMMRRANSQFTRQFFREHAGLGCPSEAPIFIVGLPRTGSTLVEQILSSHSAVEGLGEHPALGGIALRLASKERARPRSADGAAPEPFESENLRALGEEYLQRTQKSRKLGRPRFTDKMPGNFHHLGVICTILPKARIVDVRRNPLDCCLSNFKQNFASGSGPSFDLSEMGRYYRNYVELMAHFDDVLPGRVHRVFYEELVRNPEAEIRRLLEYCGLPFEEQCLRFHETDRSILTASSEQVRLPMYQEGVDQWRPFESRLEPLKTALGSVLTLYPEIPNRF